EVLDLPGGEGAEVDTQVLVVEAKAEARDLRQRVAKVHPGAEAVGGVVGQVELTVVGGTVKDIEARADTVRGVVRIAVGKLQVGLVGTAVEADTHLVAGAEEIVFLKVGAEHQTRALGKARSEEHTSELQSR